MSVPTVAVDCETTSLAPWRRAWEIAMIRREPNVTEATTLLVVSDIDLSRADAKALEIGRFHERHPRFNAEQIPDGVEYVTEADAALIVEEVTRGAHLIGANVSFDAYTLAPMLRRHGLVAGWHYHLIDVQPLAVGWIFAKDPGSPVARPPYFGRELVAAVEALSGINGIGPDDEDEIHTALGDARWALRLYDAIAGGRP